MRRATAGLIAIAAALLAAAPALGDSGPPLSVPEATLAHALTCKRLDTSAREPVLFVPGTSETPAMFDWNWFRYADAQGWPYCTVELPDAATADIQVAAEYATYAIRRMNALTGRRVQIVGHSQGGMVPRWSLRFWPDTRAMVDDLVGLAPSNHGTITAIADCNAQGGCPASFWQQRSDAKFIAALNAGFETVPGVDYTVAFTRFDEIVVPNQDAQTGSSALRASGPAVSNVRIQDVCPNDTGEHLAMGTFDTTGAAIAIDALDHAGPADPARIPASTCASPFMPGVNPATFGTDFAAFGAAIGNATGAAQKLPAEPPLKCYVTNACPPSAAAPRVRLELAPRRVTAGRRTRVVARGTLVSAGGGTAPARGGIVRLGGLRKTLDTHGRTTLRLTLHRAGRRLATLSVPTVGAARASLRVIRAARRHAPRGPRFTG